MHSLLLPVHRHYNLRFPQPAAAVLLHLSVHPLQVPDTDLQCL